MYVKVFFAEIGDLVKLSRLVGQAPCQILGLNNARCESDLVGREVLVEVCVGALRRDIGQYYKEEEGCVMTDRST